MSILGPALTTWWATFKYGISTRCVLIFFFIFFPKHWASFFVFFFPLPLNHSALACLFIMYLPLLWSLVSPAPCQTCPFPPACLSITSLPALVLATRFNDHRQHISPVAAFNEAVSCICIWTICKSRLEFGKCETKKKNQPYQQYETPTKSPPNESTDFQIRSLSLFWSSIARAVFFQFPSTIFNQHPVNHERPPHCYTFKYIPIICHVLFPRFRLSSLILDCITKS